MGVKQSKYTTSENSPRNENESEKPKMKTSLRFSKKGKKYSKEKANSNFDEMIETNKLDNLYPPLSSKQGSITEEIDGGPLNYYPMKKRGPVYIISNIVGDELFPFRQGGANDVGKLTCCFEEFGFNVQSVSNLTSKEMQEHCDDWAMRDYRNADCVIVVILTHGKQPDQLQGFDGKCVALDALLSPFRKFNRTLVGKPKIFFIQACRGEVPNIGIKDDTAVSVIAQEEEPEEDVAGVPTASNNVLRSSMNWNSENSGLLPPQADHLIAFSTGIGHPAYRIADNCNGSWSPADGSELGSWYMDELTKVLYEELKYSSSKSKRHRQRHLVDIITEVQGRVSNKVTGDREPKLKVQMPEFTSRLRGPIFIS